MAQHPPSRFVTSGIFPAGSLIACMILLAVFAVHTPALGAASSTPEPIATFSIVGYDPETGELGVAVESKFFAVGAVVPWARAEVGAIATQAFGNTTYGPRGLELLSLGLKPEQVVELLTSTDEDRERRQLGIVDAAGNSATYTGNSCNVWAGGRTGKNYTAQGNILVSQQVVDAMCKAFEETSGDLSEKLWAALDAGQKAGGDSRGQQSAALLVVKKGGGYAGFNDRYIDLRVDDHPEPIKELGRLLKIQHAMSKMNEATAFYREKKYSEAVEAARKAVEYNPDYGDAHYDLACFLSLAGDVDSSLKSLKTALKLSPGLLSLAEKDADLNNIRLDSRYKQIISAAAKSQKTKRR
ncbi:MAG: DUF1028 domain-containing protein [Candidatus Eisenbacteria bacterium]|nr:DUF1028 domain-containing protein [Candidatus Eisenbacteria bacterium]